MLSVTPTYHVVAIGRACVSPGIPRFSPHYLRRRRVSLLHRQGRSWAEIGRFVGQRKLSVTADTYTHVMLDDREVGTSSRWLPNELRSAQSRPAAPIPS